MKRFDTVVIGGGAMGSSTAWWLARRGRSVLLAEQFERGHVRGSSHGAVRIFRLAYADPDYVAMCRRSLQLWRELEDDCGESLLELVGAYDHGPEGSIDGVDAALRESGVPFERLTPEEAHERVPAMRFDRDVLFHADAGRSFADRSVQALQRRAAELGADVRFATRAAARPHAGGVEVDLEGEGGGETVAADTVVVTAGAWVDQVAGAMAALPRFTITQEQAVHFAPIDPAAVLPSFIHHTEPSRYGVHSPAEGLKVGGHHEGPATTGDARGFELDPARIATIEHYARTWIPGVEPTARLGATCLYTTTANDDFVLDRVGQVVIGSPCSGHGFKFTPLVGRLLADLAGDPASVSQIAPRHRLAAFG
jgi:sarcosine oxidase